MWIGNGIKTKIHLLWWLIKILQIHHFSEHSEASPKFHAWAVSDRRSNHQVPSSWEFSESEMRCEYSADCENKDAEALRQLLNRGEGILVKMPASSSWKFWESSSWPAMVFRRKIALFEATDPSLHLPKWVNLFPRDQAEFRESHFISDTFHQEILEDNSSFDMVIWSLNGFSDSYILRRLKCEPPMWTNCDPVSDKWVWGISIHWSIARLIYFAHCRNRLAVIAFVIPDIWSILRCCYFLDFLKPQCSDFWSVKCRINYNQSPYFSLSIYYARSFRHLPSRTSRQSHIVKAQTPANDV
jgi:hypothetical protein